MKFVVAEGELAKLIGSEAVAALRSMGKAQLKALGADAAARATFKLRRREAIAGTQDDVIPFHRDSSLVVVNVALNDAECFSGLSGPGPPPAPAPPPAPEPPRSRARRRPSAASSPPSDDGW